MADLNSVSLTGRLTKDVDHRTTQSGTEVANVTIAVNGFKENDTSFIDLVLFGKTAQAASKYISKGQQIGVTGRLKQESWEDKTSGQKRSKLVVVVENLQLPPKGSASEKANTDTVLEDIDDKPIDLSGLNIPF